MKELIISQFQHNRGGLHAREFASLKLITVSIQHPISITNLKYLKYICKLKVIETFKV